MNQVYQITLYPTPAQERILQRYFVAHRSIYNYFRDVYAAAYERNQNQFDEAAANRLLERLVQQRRSLQAVDFLVLQSALDEVNADFLIFYHSVKTGLTKKKMPRRISEPSQRKLCRISADTNPMPYSQEWIHIRGLGRLDYDAARLEGTIRQVTITQTHHYTMSVLCEDHEDQHYPFTDQAIGIIRSVNGFAITSTGKYYRDAPEILRLRAQWSALGPQLPLDGPAAPLLTLNGEQKALRKALAQENKKFIAHLTTHFVKYNDRIYIEGLDEAIFERPLLSTEDFLWKSFLEHLEQKASRNQRVYLELPLPPPGLCSGCGTLHHIEGLELRGRWTCAQCKTPHHTDTNRAQNLLQHGEVRSAYLDPRTD